MRKSKSVIRALLERLFQRGEAPPAGPRGTRAKVGTPPPREQRAEPAGGNPAAIGDSDPPPWEFLFDECGSDWPRAPAEQASPDAEEQVAVLLPLLREHFEAHQPGPASFPPIAARIVEVIEKPDVDFNHVVRLVNQDPAITAEVLKVANSPLYRRDLEVANVRQAVTHIGLRDVASIAVSVAGRSLYNMETRAELEEFGPYFGGLFHGAMTAAFSAGWLTVQSDFGGTDSAFCAGMFHAIGKPIALRSLAALRISGQVQFAISPSAIDRALDEVSVEVGVRMHQVWSLPKRLALVCAHQHDDVVPPEADVLELHIVRVVAALNALRAGNYVRPGLVDHARQSLAALRIDRFQLRALNAEIRELAQRVTDLFGVVDLPPRG